MRRVSAAATLVVQHLSSLAPSAPAARASLRVPASSSSTTHLSPLSCSPTTSFLPAPVGFSAPLARLLCTGTAQHPPTRMLVRVSSSAALQGARLGGPRRPCGGGTNGSGAMAATAAAAAATAEAAPAAMAAAAAAAAAARGSHHPTRPWAAAHVRGMSILTRASTSSSGGSGSSSSDRGALQPRGATAAPAAFSSSSPSAAAAADDAPAPPPSSPSASSSSATAHRAHSHHRRPRLRVRSGASMLPHPDKAHRGGEDAFFIADGPALHARTRGRASPSSSSSSSANGGNTDPLTGTTTSCAVAADAALRAHDEDDPHDGHHPHHHAAFGVADGVGGWAEVGVDAGAYARMLMDCARDEAERAMLEAAEASAARRRRQREAAAAKAAAGEAATDGAAAPSSSPDQHHHENADGDDDEDDEPPRLSAQDILERAFYRTDVQGSSTACVLVLNGATLAASNLGDSGFCVVRGGATAFQSPQQQHNFNFPYQLGSAESMSDQPQAAMRFEMEVAPGDTVVVGSDGLWDNVFAEEAAAIVSRCRGAGQGPDEAAATLARYARMRAADAKHHSPFSYAAVAAGYVYVGGKMDDIAVIVAYVEDAHGGGGGGGGGAAGADEAAAAATAGDAERPRSRL